MSNNIFKRVEEAVRQAREHAFVHELRYYTPQRYDISVDADMFGDYTITVEKIGGAYIEIAMDEDYIDTISVDVGSATSLGKELETDLALDDIVDNLRAALELAEQDKLNEALTVLAQEKEVA